MSSPAHFAVADTNVCLDLHWGGLLRFISHLPITTVLLDVTAREITKQDKSIFLGSGFQPDSANAAEISTVATLRKKYQAPSTPDLIALCVCKQRNWILLTGDGNLRKAALAENVRCHGIFWLLDQLESRVSFNQLHSSLTAIIEAGAFLPTAECRKRLDRWSGKK